MEQQETHTPEPWTYVPDEYNEGDLAELCAGGSIMADDYFIAAIHMDVPGYEANARRIVACVNACKGISTDVLEKPDASSDLISALRVVEAERDALKADAERLAVALRRFGQHSHGNDLVSPCYRLAWGLAHTSDSECNCGLYAALAAHQEAAHD